MIRGNRDGDLKEIKKEKGRQSLSLSVSSSTSVITSREQKALHNASLDVVVSTCVKAERSVAGVLEKRKATPSKSNGLLLKSLCCIERKAGRG